MDNGFHKYNSLVMTKAIPNYHHQQNGIQTLLQNHLMTIKFS